MGVTAQKLSSTQFAADMDLAGGVLGHDNYEQLEEKS